jgi:glutamyl-tRNA reductase
MMTSEKTMHVSVTGISHHTTPISVRELLAFSGDAVPVALQRLSDRFEGAAILSTCNRTELYLVSDHTVARSDALTALAAARGIMTPEGIDAYHYDGAETIRHLYRVAAGADSLVIGESEILGQVREAFSATTAAGTSNPVLARLFHTAMRVGRRARSETEIGAHGLSVAAIAVALSKNALGSLARKTVLVVGAGEVGQRAAAALVQSGAGRLLVTTRTSGRAQEIAEQMNGVAIPFEDLSAALSESDVVISATSAQEPVVTRDMLSAAMSGRAERPMVIVDIAVPRDVEPSARDVPGVHLYDIDELEAVANKNLDARKREVSAVEEILEDEARRFDAWLSGQHVEPTIAALRRRAETTRQSELDRTFARLPGLSDLDRQRIEAMSRALVNRLLHDPVTRLRTPGSERHLDAVRELFDLDGE